MISINSTSIAHKFETSQRLADEVADYQKNGGTIIKLNATTSTDYDPVLSLRSEIRCMLARLKSKGYTQKAIIQHCECNKSIISKIINNIDCISIETLQHIQGKLSELL